MHLHRKLRLSALAVVLASCATLGQIIQPPTFDVASGRQAELRLLGPSPSRPLGGAAVRLWADVTNPNAFGLTLSTVEGQLALDGVKAADVDLPLGLPLAAGQSTVIPLDIGIGFADVPRIATVLGRAVTNQEVEYQLVGRFGVDAGPLGRPTFGPNTLLRGTLRVER